jgi:hypothetical protein
MISEKKMRLMDTVINCVIAGSICMMILSVVNLLLAF